MSPSLNSLNVPKATFCARALFAIWVEAKGWMASRVLKRCDCYSPSLRRASSLLDLSTRPIRDAGCVLVIRVETIPSNRPSLVVNDPVAKKPAPAAGSLAVYFEANPTPMVQCPNTLHRCQVIRSSRVRHPQPSMRFVADPGTPMGRCRPCSIPKVRFARAPIPTVQSGMCSLTPMARYPPSTQQRCWSAPDLRSHVEPPTHAAQRLEDRL